MRYQKGNSIMSNIRLSHITEKFSSLFQTANSSKILPKVRNTSIPSSLASERTHSHINVNASKVAKLATAPTATIVKDYKRSTAPTALPIYKILTTKLFPLSITDSFKDYQLRHDLETAQTELLSLLPVENHPTRDVSIVKTDIGNGRFINELCIKPKDVPYENLNHFVMIHGYGAGLGFYLKNFNEMGKDSKDWCVHSIDLLGYGLSSRPEFTNPKDFESWFLDSLETWRIKRGINRMFICCHSMGAHLSIHYSIKYPDIVQKMMLVSPAGIIRPPDAPDVPWWFTYLWEWNISPFSLIRNGGPFGSLITSGWTYRRFAKLTKEEQKRLHKYAYRIFNAKGSGEYFMSSILAPGGVPKNPLIDTLVPKLNCDTVWVYGDEDWMPKEGGLRAVEMLSKKGLQAEFKVIDNSGHHLYLDNYEQFNGFVNEELQRYSDKFGQD